MLAQYILSHVLFSGSCEDTGKEANLLAKKCQLIADVVAIVAKSSDKYQRNPDGQLSVLE